MVFFYKPIKVGLYGVFVFAGMLDSAGQVVFFLTKINVGSFGKFVGEFWDGVRGKF